MADFDVAVIGGGPAGYSAALKAAERGASVVLIEAERPGGTCVHHACIPTNIMLGAAGAFVEAREMDVLGVFAVGQDFNFARAAARKDVLVKRMGAGIEAALRMRGVTVIAGRAAFASPSQLSVSTGSGSETVSAKSFVIATGTRWELPQFPGVAPSVVVTPDVVQGLPIVPADVVVVGGGPSGGAFGLEYAALLAIAGCEVAFAEPGERLLPGLDGAIAEVARNMLAAMGVTIFEGASLGGKDGRVVITHREGESSVPATMIVEADPRRPFFQSLNLEAAGVKTSDVVPADRACRTNVPHIFAAGDVTGGAMLSSAASHMGEVAAINATGGDAATRLSALPHVLHTIPEVGWAGLTEDQARARGYDVISGVFDLSYNARAIALGAREGLVKVVAERELGEVLGVHVVGPLVSETLAVAAAVIQAEVTVHDLAAMVHWHPSVAEGLVEAAKRALS